MDFHIPDMPGPWTHIFLLGLGPELSGEDLQDGLAHPAPLGEGGEGEVVRLHLPQPCTQVSASSKIES